MRPGVERRGTHRHDGGPRLTPRLAAGVHLPNRDSDKPARDSDRAACALSVGGATRLGRMTEIPPPPA